MHDLGIVPEMVRGAHTRVMTKNEVLVVNTTKVHVTFCFAALRYKRAGFHKVVATGAAGHLSRQGDGRWRLSPALSLAPHGGGEEIP